MSGKPEIAVSSTPTAESTDSRVRFTREILGDALVGLMQESPFEKITVQDILDRAGVGRTTFYSHYSDKQDLFLSDVEDFLEGMASCLDRCQASPLRLAPVREIFVHLADMTAFYKALNASGKLTEVRELGIACFAKSIARRLAITEQISPGPELRAVSRALAGALFALLDGWMYEPERMSPEAAEQLFHRLAWNGVQQITGFSRPAPAQLS